MSLPLALFSQAAPDHALTFDGVNDYVETSVAAIPTSGNFTVEFWAECPTAPSSLRDILSQGSFGNALYIGTDSANNIRLGDGWGSVSPAIPFPVGGWHHFALVRSTASAYFYIDGVLKASKGTAMANPNASNGLRLGRQYAGQAEYWQGSIGDVRVWGRDLAASELQQTLAGPAPELIDWWQFDEGAGTTCTSLGKYGNPGTLLNGPFWIASSSLTLTAPASALTFDGVNDYVETSTAVIPTSGDFTVEFWAECPTAPNATRDVLSQGSSGNALYIGTDSSNRIRIGDGWAVSPPIPIPVGGWHHFALVKSSTNCQFYIDGVLKGNKGSTMVNPNASNGLRLGRQYAGQGEYWAGGIGDVRIWSRALAYQELQQSLTGGETDLAAWWKLDEGAGTTCRSFSKSGVVGTLLNGPFWIRNSTLTLIPPASSLSFDGVNDYVETSRAVIPSSGDFTVELWAECPKVPNSYREIISQGSAGNALYLGVDLSNNVRLGDAWGSITPAIPFPIGGWHHFAWVKSSANTQLYIDGVLKANRGSAMANPAASYGLRLGRQYGGNGEYWPGGIGDVRIWSRALAYSELQQNLTGTEANLVSWWRFNESTGTTCTPLGSSSVAATLTNGPLWVTPFTFTDNGASLEITGCPAFPYGAMDIPAAINGKPVTRIGDRAFVSCWGLTSVNVPAGVTSIGYAAFLNCSGLTSVTLPASVTSIGASAFSYCSGLTNVTLPAGITSIESNGFSYCSGLTSVTLPAGVTRIGDAAFRDCSGLTSVSLPASVTSIGNEAFRGCGGLASVTLPANLASIGIFGFLGCGLTSVTIPASVTSIGDYLFYQCYGLANVEFLGNAPTMNSNVFTSVASGLTVKFHSGATGFTSPTWMGYPSVEVNPEIEVEQPAGTGLTDGAAAVGFGVVPTGALSSHTFTIRNSGTSLLTGLAVTVDGSNASEFTSGSLAASVLEPGTSMTFTVSFTPGALGSRTADLHIASSDIDENPFDIHLSGEAVPLTFTDTGSSITITGSSPKALGALTIPAIINGKPVTAIADLAFRDCSGLTSVTIPTGVTSIGVRAFFACRLTSVTIPASVTSIADYAYQGCKDLTSIEFMGNAPSMGMNVFDANIAERFIVKYHNGATGFTSPIWLGFLSDNVDLNPEIEVEQPAATGLLAGVSTVDFSSVPSGGRGSLTFTIRNSGLDALSGLAVTVNGTNGTQDNEFSLDGLDATRLEPGESTTFTLSFAPISLGTRTGVAHIASNDADENPFDISLSGEGSNFRFTDDGTSITITGCYAASGVLSIPASIKGKPVTGIGASAFSGSSDLTGVIFPASVTSIGTSAFAGCSGLTSVTIPAGVTSIGLGAFLQCGALNTIAVAVANPNYSSLDGVLFDKLRTTLVQCPGHKTGSYTIPSSVTSIGDFALALCGALTNVTLPASVTRIGTGAFYECRGLTSLTIPTSVTSIGDHAFRDCSGLTGLTIPSGVTRLGDYVLSGCSGLTSATLATGVTQIGNYTFNGCGKLTSLTIPTSVTSIGNHAFDGCVGLTSVTLQAGLTSIGDYAFYLCSGLTSVTLPTSLTSIGNGAFAGCGGLASVAIPKNVTSIGAFAFVMCNGLNAITVDAANPNYSSLDGVLFNKLRSTLVQWPGNKSFVGALPASVTSIGSGAFAFCTRLTSVTLPTAVTSIGDYAFQGCSGLTSIVFMGNAPTLGSTVFSGVASGFTVRYHNGATGFTPITWLGYPSDNLDLEAEIEVTQAGTGLTDGAATVGFGSLPTGATSVRTFTIHNPGLDALTRLAITVTGSNADEFTVDYFYAPGVMPGDSTTFTVAFAPLALGSRTAVLHLANNDPDENPFDINLSGEATPMRFTYQDDGSGILITGFTSAPVGALEIPSTINGIPVTAIGDSAFRNCGGLTSVTIPASVGFIGNSAFAGCGGLTSAEFQGDAPYMGSGVFDNAHSGFTVRYHNGAMDFTPLIWLGYPSDILDADPEIEVEQPVGTGLTDGASTVNWGSVPIGAGCNRTFTIRNPGLDALTGLALTVTGANAGEFTVGSPGASSLAPGADTTFTVALAPGALGSRTAVLHISSNDPDENPFDINLSGQATPMNFTYVDNGSSITITGMTSVPLGALEIPSTINGKPVTRIGAEAFYECSGLTSVTIPASATSLEDRAFYGCSGLTNVIIPNSVTSIGNAAFYQCSGLTSMTLSSSMTSIGHEVFYGCSGLTSVTIPPSVTSIGILAFTACSGLTSVTIPPSVTHIWNAAFSRCTGLTSVTIPTSVTSISMYAFEDCSGLTSVTIPPGVTRIETGTFNGCSGLTSVTIPTSVTEIGDAAFASCSGLPSVTISASVTSLGEAPFMLCSGLTTITVDGANPNYCSVDGFLFNKLQTTLIQWIGNDAASCTIPSSVTSIGGSAFYGCSGLTSVTIPTSVTRIGNSAFCGCSGLTGVTIPPSVTDLGSLAFYDCSGLTSVTIPPSVTSIGQAVFSGCTGLTNVTIPFGMTRIGYYAFNACTGLTSVTIPSSVTHIDDFAFFGCSRLTSAEFLGNAPVMGRVVFNNTASGFTVQYHSGATGFTSPTWLDYPSLNVDTSPYGIWRTGRFTPADVATGLTTPAADFDHDGIPNMLEYAFGGDPKVPTVAGVAPAPHVVGNKLQLSFSCDATRTDITYTVQSASTLAPNSWSDIATSVGGATTLPIGSLSTVTDTGSGLRTVTVTDATASSGGKRFLRVKVTSP